MCDIERRLFGLKFALFVCTAIGTIVMAAAVLFPSLFEQGNLEWLRKTIIVLVPLGLCVLWLIARVVHRDSLDHIKYCRGARRHAR